MKMELPTKDKQKKRDRESRLKQTKEEETCEVTHNRSPKQTKLKTVAPVTPNSTYSWQTKL